MNFTKSENLALLSKKGDAKAKEELIKEFTPFILNLCNKSHVNSFEFEDLKNECYKTLLRCVQLYSPDKHRFVAYATNAIKNSINNLIRTSIRRENREGLKALILDDNLDRVLSYDMDFVEDKLCKAALNKKLKEAINNLNMEEKELLDFIFFRNYSLKKYAQFKEIPYRRAVYMKNTLLKKIKKDVSIVFLQQ